MSSSLIRNDRVDASSFNSLRERLREASGKDPHKEITKDLDGVLQASVISLVQGEEIGEALERTELQQESVSIPTTTLSRE